MAARLLASNFHLPSSTVFARTMSSKVNLSTMKPLKLYTLGTPNGLKTSVFIEELKAVYPELKYEAIKIDISKNTQKEDWFIKLNPNGRIPTLVDPNRGDFPVMETAAILLYLEKHYDQEHKFSFPSDSPEDDDYRSKILQNMFFVHGGIGPMQGQSNHFYRYAPEKIPYAIKRYRDETKRLYDVLDIMLNNRDYLVGPGKGKYTIADANAFPWVLFGPLAGVPKSEYPPNVRAWVDRNLAREATIKGLHVPEHSDLLDKIIATGEDPTPPKNADSK